MTQDGTCLARWPPTFALSLGQWGSSLNVPYPIIGYRLLYLRKRLTWQQNRDKWNQQINNTFRMD